MIAASLSQAELERALAEHQSFLARQRGGKKLNLSRRRGAGLDFGRTKLVSGEFTGAVFEQSNFVQADLSFANLYCTRLIDCNFRFAKLIRADLRGAKLRSGDFSFATLDEADFRDGTLWEVDADGLLTDTSGVHAAVRSTTSFEGASFKDAKLGGSVLKGTDLSYANFEGACLKGADFSGCILRDVNFSRATLTKCNFKGAKLPGAVLTGAVLDDTNFEGADLTTALIDPGGLRKARTHGTVLPRGLDTLDQSLKDIIRSHLIWIDSSGRSGSQAALVGLDMSRACLNEVILPAARLSRSVLQHAEFDRGNFVLSDLSGCNATGASFVGADCRGAKIHGQHDGARQSGAGERRLHDPDPRRRWPEAILKLCRLRPQRREHDARKPRRLRFFAGDAARRQSFGRESRGR